MGIMGIFKGMVVRILRNGDNILSVWREEGCWDGARIVCRGASLPRILATANHPYSG